MRILICHNYYKVPGGEDSVVEAEYSLLKDFGHEVILYKRSNTELDSCSPAGKLKHLFSLGWSSQTHKDIKALIEKFKPDVAHFHNIFYVITPAAYFACKEQGVSVVQSQHNFRLSCSNGLFYRKNRVCEDCLKKSLWEGVYHGCYRNSCVLTTFIAGMLMDHWKKGTWQKMVDVYVTASQFGRQKLAMAGIPADKIVVKPNFVYPDPGMRERLQTKGYALYVGRLSPEKGVKVLIEAWRSIPNFTLRVIGVGPLSDFLKSYVKQHNISNVEFRGYVNHEEYDKSMRQAAFLIVPSLAYENFPRVVAEAFAYGVPVLASRLGSLEEIIKEEEMGLLSAPGDISELSQKIHWMITHEDELLKISANVRRLYEEKYTAKKNYECLVNIYNKAMGHRQNSCESLSCLGGADQ